MANERTYEIRDLRNGDWYWIHKAVINDYVQKIGATGVIVYSFLASLANDRQSCFPSQKYIADKLGYSRATVNRAMKRLEDNGLTRTEKRSRYHCVYHLLKIRCNSSEIQMSHRRNSGVIYFDTNDNNITRNINNNVRKDNNFMNSKPNALDEFRPGTRLELLAFDLASALNDRKSLPVYLSYARRYPESLLRRILGEVKEIPDRDIKKSRAALFSYLIKKYAQENDQSHRA
jgi:biotin operon repressor